MPAAAQNEKSAKPEPDWKAIATALAQRLVFVATYLRDPPGGGGLVFNRTDNTMQHWRDYAADAIEMIPGVTVDRDMLHAQALPRSKRAKAIKALEAKRAAEKSKEDA